MPVQLKVQGNIAHITIDNPPVNATSQAVRRGLWEAMERAENDPGITAVLLSCAGRTFVAGADISEFGKPPVEPHLPDLLTRIDSSATPWIAAIHGTALGGGLELAMACRFRIADPQARMGLPEVNLGLIPGAGGTVRLPRLVPATEALTMIATGKPITAQKAQEIGLVDAVAEGDLLSHAQDFTRGQIGKPLPPATSDRNLPAPDWETFETQAEKITKRARGQHAPLAAIRALRNAYTMPVAEALAQERETFLALREDPQSAALRHVFFAERATARIDRLKNVSPLPLSQIGIVGGGTMGAGIATACLLSGFEVIMVERDPDAAEVGRDRVEKILQSSLKRGLISTEKHALILSKFNSKSDYKSLSSADLIIEAVFEDFEVKKSVFAELDRVVRTDTILATNTSYLDVEALAKETANPNRVVGLHFFSPAHIMKLLEIVTPKGLDDRVLAAALNFAKTLRKTPVLAGVCDGFIANRIMSAYRRECEYMLEDGALPDEIDRAMIGFGLPMGIFAMQDMAGLDIAWAMRKRRAATRDPDERYVEIADRLCERGRFGRKTGRGYYLYDESGKAQIDPDVTELIEAESTRKGITRQTIPQDEIMSRILSAMQREGQAILDEGIARSADDIDVVMINAYGFPRWRGGPMYMLAQSGS